MKKILLIGEIYSENLGDGILCNCVKNIIKDNIEDVDIVMMDISDRKGFKEISKENEKEYLNKGKTSLNRLRKAFEYPLNLRRYLKQYKRVKKLCEEQYDLAIFAGGQMIMSYFAFPIYYIVKYLSKNNIPIIFNACGVGENNSRILKIMLRKALSNKNVKFISSRDDVDTINKLYLKKGKKATKTYDLGLWTKENYKINKKNSDVIGLGVMKVSDYSDNNIIRFWKEIIKILEEKNISWKVFCNGNINDYDLCKKIVEDYSGKLEKRPIRPEELVNIIANYKGIISFRLHSHIVACSLGIPTVGIEWDKKIRYFFENIGDINGCMNYHNSAEEIIERLKEKSEKSFDFGKIQKQKEFSKNLLISQIKENML